MSRRDFPRLLRKPLNYELKIKLIWSLTKSLSTPHAAIQKYVRTSETQNLSMSSYNKVIWYY